MMGLKPRSLALPFPAASTPAHNPPPGMPGALSPGWAPSSCRKSEVPAPAHGFLSEGDGNQHALKTEAGALGD